MRLTETVDFFLNGVWLCVLNYSSIATAREYAKEYQQSLVETLLDAIDDVLSVTLKNVKKPNWSIEYLGSRSCVNWRRGSALRSYTV